MRVGSLEWTARILAGLDCRFTVVQPDELRASVRKLGERLLPSDARPPPSARNSRERVRRLNV